MTGYSAQVESVDLTGFDLMPAPGAALEPAFDRQRYLLDLGVHPNKRLVNSNQEAEPRVRWRKRKEWQLVTRRSYDRGAQLDRAYLVVIIWTRTPSEGFRDVQNVHYTTKGICDGLVSKKAEFDDDGNEINPEQIGWLIDDNDKVIIGPDLRRGLDPSLGKAQCRVTVGIAELQPHEMAWWLNGAHYEQLEIGV